MNEPATPRTQRRGFAGLPPVLKIAVWIGSVAALAGVVQGGGWLLGLEFQILSSASGGRALLLTMALASLFVMMRADRRPLADYGLAVGSGWPRQWFAGLVIGVLFYGGYCAVAVALGGLSLKTDSLGAYRIASATLSAMAAIPVAATQQVIFSGYLLSILRERHSRLTAAAATGLLFALLNHINYPSALTSPAGWALSAGMFFVATLLGLVRLASGNVVFPAGILTGCIMVRRLARKTFMLGLGGHEGYASLLAPNEDPRQGPAFWIALAVAIVATFVWLRRRGEAKVPASVSEVHRSFKRLVPFSNLNILAPLDVWLSQLARARFRVGIAYLPRLLAILAFSSVNTVLSLPERILLPLVLRGRRVADPVFIVGVHRSGTTHLHNLMSRDGRFCSPRVYQALNPFGFLFSGWLITPLIAGFLPWRRPMDRVAFHILAPQEEEFAMAGMCGLSPYWGFTLPRQVARYDRFIYSDGFSPAERQRWKRLYLHFLRMLTFWSGRVPLLKSPYNTGRLALLLEMFPRAKFVHITRHPYAVYRSNLHLAREGLVMFQLQDPDPSDSFETRFLAKYRELEETLARDTANLPAEQIAHVRLDDLERDPVGQIRQIYSRLDLALEPEFERKLKDYVARLGDFQKNRFAPLAPPTRREIDAVMGSWMQQWGYSAEGPTQAEQADKAA